jgi:hypothetical protein
MGEGGNMNRVEKMLPLCGRVSCHGHELTDMVREGLRIIEEHIELTVVADCSSATYYAHETMSWWRIYPRDVALAGRMFLEGGWDYSEWCSITTHEELLEEPS